MEEIVFPVPNICEFLTTESKLRVYYTTERDEQGSKINDFFLRAEDLFNEMNWQKKLRGKIPVFECPGMIGFGTSHPDIDSRKQWFRPEEIYFLSRSFYIVLALNAAIDHQRDSSRLRSRPTCCTRVVKRFLGLLR